MNPMLEPFLAAADAAAAARPEVDPEIARDLMVEAATMLHNGLALEGVDAQDLPTVVAGLAQALTAPDPTAALHDLGRGSDGHAATYLVAASILRI